MTVYPILPQLIYISGHSLKTSMVLKKALVESLNVGTVVNLWSSGMDPDWAALGVDYIHQPTADGKEVPEELLLLASMLTERLERDYEHPLLIQCHAGANRSALLAGLIMTRLGVPGADAVDMIRTRRGATALNNESFAAYLAGIGG